MMLIVYYLVLVVLGDVAAVMLCLWIERALARRKSSDLPVPVFCHPLGGLGSGYSPIRTEGDNHEYGSGARPVAFLTTRSDRPEEAGQKFSTERSPTTHAFGRMLPSSFSTPAAGTNDVLQVRLQRPPRRQLGLVGQLEDGLIAAHRIGGFGEESGVRVKPARIASDAGVGRSNPDLVVGSAWNEAFVDQAAIGIEINKGLLRRSSDHTAE